MNKVLFGALSLFLLFLLSACTTSESSEVGNNGSKQSDCTALSPANHYEEDSGHSAGFKWAEQNDPARCGGNSQSFIEGCEEYRRQSSDYNDCLNKSR